MTSCHVLNCFQNKFTWSYHSNKNCLIYKIMLYQQIEIKTPSCCNIQPAVESRIFPNVHYTYILFGSLASRYKYLISSFHTVLLVRNKLSFAIDSVDLFCAGSSDTFFSVQFRLLSTAVLVIPIQIR